jgi:NTE family protein
VAAMYAGGLTVDEIREIVFDMDWLSIVRPHLSSRGFFTSRKIEQLIVDNVPAKTFGETKISLRIVATDLVSGGEYVFQHDHESLGFAVRASSTIPGIFSPVEYKGMYLVDGCLVNNIPVSTLRPLRPNKIIAVNVVPHIPMKQAPKDFFGVLARMNDIYQAAAEDGLPPGDFLLSPIKEYFPVTKQTKEIYQKLEKLGETEALHHLGTIKRYA